MQVAVGAGHFLRALWFGGILRVLFGADPRSGADKAGVARIRCASGHAVQIIDADA